MTIDDRLLDKITREAETSPRLRMNHNLHERPDSGAQRLVNVLLPGTHLPVHRHMHTAETYILLRGRMKVLLYNDRGEQTGCHLLAPAHGNYGIHIPMGQWHTVEVLEPTAILEVKDGPYTPLAPGDILNI